MCSLTPRMWKAGLYVCRFYLCLYVTVLHVTRYQFGFRQNPPRAFSFWFFLLTSIQRTATKVFPTLFRPPACTLVHPYPGPPAFLSACTLVHPYSDPPAFLSACTLVHPHSYPPALWSNPTQARPHSGPPALWSVALFPVYWVNLSRVASGQNCELSADMGEV